MPRVIRSHRDTHVTGEGVNRLVIAAGLAWSIAFIVIGLVFELQTFGDGSIFSYAVAVRDAWAFHWRNISGRLFSYAVAYIPAEAYVGLTKDAAGGIVIYGAIYFAAPLVGLLATVIADRSRQRLIFQAACLSTACLGPLVFGCPTEMWMAHVVFWPALAICHDAPASLRGAVAVFLSLLALLFTHEGAAIFALAILVTLALRGWQDAAFVRGYLIFGLVMAIWIAVKWAVRPDDYIAGVLDSAAMRFIDPANLTRPALLVLLATLGAYGAAVFLLERARLKEPATCAACLVGLFLLAYWLWFDDYLHADDRYVLRTVLLMATPPLGFMAAAAALRHDHRIKIALSMSPLATVAWKASASRIATGAILLVMLVHAVETAKFVTQWTEYRAAVQRLAMGDEADPILGHSEFVSSRRIGASLNRLSWNSTTPFLSVLVAPGFAPDRLVVDPDANYFWISCDTAQRSERIADTVPGRRLIRIHACLHR